MHSRIVQRMINPHLDNTLFIVITDSNTHNSQSCTLLLVKQKTKLISTCIWMMWPVEIYIFQIIYKSSVLRNMNPGLVYIVKIELFFHIWGLLGQNN